MAIVKSLYVKRDHADTLSRIEARLVEEFGEGHGMFSSWMLEAAKFYLEFGGESGLLSLIRQAIRLELENVDSIQVSGDRPLADEAEVQEFFSAFKQ